MIVEIVGIGAPNKGAELMLVSIMEQVKQRYPEAKFVLEPYTSYEERAKYGCLQKAWFTVKGFQCGNVFSVLPERIRRKFGIVLDREVDVIMDGSGFAYGEQWGANKIRNRLTRYIDGWKKQGKKVIILPQALGPFESEEVKSNIVPVFEKANIVFARDNKSFEYSQSLVNNTLYQAPDFTNLCKGIVPPSLENSELDICIIPNSKMVDMTSQSSDDYVDMLVNAVNLAQNNGRLPFLLVHEGKKDFALAEAVNDKLRTKLDILSFDDPKHIKGVIGKSKLVISSRFHGLVSSLSQGVPCIATGWSHKYQMLMGDYGCEQLLVANSEELVAMLRSLMDEQTYLETSHKITVNAAEQKLLSQEMWQKVFDVIEK